MCFLIAVPTVADFLSCTLFVSNYSSSDRGDSQTFHLYTGPEPGSAMYKLCSFENETNLSGLFLSLVNLLISIAYDIQSRKTWTQDWPLPPRAA